MTPSPDHFPSPQTPPLRCAGALIVDGDGRVFVQRRSMWRSLFPGCWDIVGGHVEAGETLDQALRREVWEETGWTVTEVLDLVGEYAYRGDDGLERMETDYLVRVDGDLDAPALEDGKVTQYRWLAGAELDVLDDPTYGPIRRIVSDGFAALRRLDREPLVGYARLIAPAIDRAFIDGMGLCRQYSAAELAQRHGRGAGAILIEFRTALAEPGRAVSAAGLAAVGRYRDLARLRAAVDVQVEAGRLEVDPDGGFRASERGRAYLLDVWRTQGEALAGAWRDEARVARLNRSLGRVLAAALEDGGEALRAMAPVYEPEGAAAVAILLNRLGTARYHRSDAHAAAWSAAALTAAEIVAATGPQREAIEADTNVRAAPPFAALTGDERLQMLADLAALPGQRRD